MAPKSKTPEGELTAPELRKLIRAHNILSKITIPKGTDRGGLIKLIEDNNYVVDHGNKVIKPKQQRGKQITLKKAEELTKPKPVSDAVKKQRAEKKKEQEEAKEKDIKIAKKQAVQEFKQKKKEAEKKKPAPAKKEAEKKKPAPAKKSAPLLLGDKAPAPPEAPAPFKKALRTRLNKDFKKKYDKNIWDALEMYSTSTPSPAEVKKVCRKLQLKNHPDKGGDEEVFKSIREACEIYVETFKEGDDEEAEFEIPVAMTERQKSAISSFIKLYSASAIKKLDTIKKVQEAFSDGQDLYNSIQQRFTKPNQMRMKKVPEMREWFDNNMSAGKYKEYTDTQKLLKRRINAQAKKAKQ
tara:strand:- start:1224 stop:2282 length:1059 start_codon:yes stop_codon:yes gene_type:complete